MWSQWTENARAALEKTGDVISKAATEAAKTARPPPPPPPPRGAGATQATPTTTASSTSSEPKEQVKNNNTQEEEEEDHSNNSNSSQHQEGGAKLLQFSQQWQTGWSNMVETTKASLKTAQASTRALTAQMQEVVEEQQHKIMEKLQRNRTRFYKRDPSLPLDVPALQDASVVYMTDRLITMSHPAMASEYDPYNITAERKLAAVGHLLQRRHEGRYLVWNLSEVDYDTTILDNQVLTFSFPGSPSPPLGLLLKILMSMEAWLKADPRNVAVVHCLTGKGRTSTVLAAFLCWVHEAGFAAHGSSSSSSGRGGDGDIGGGGNGMQQALEYIAACKQISYEELTIPSQRRYASYFTNMLDGVRPLQQPLMLQRIIMSTAPRFARGPSKQQQKQLADTPDSENKNDAASGGEGSQDDKKQSSSQDQQQQPSEDDESTLGCAPYLQLFKAGQLLFTTPASKHFQQSPTELPFCQVSDGAISFHVQQIIQGDILIRCRHVVSDASGNKKKGPKRLSMFRAAFHTGYVPPKVMRLTKAQLDGARTDPRFPDDFFLDLIFEPVSAEELAKLQQQQEQEQKKKEEEQQQQQEQESKEEGKDDKQDGTTTTADGTTATPSDANKDGATTTTTEPSSSSTPTTTTNAAVTASTYDIMLHRDSRFWDVINERREEHAAAAAAAEKKGSGTEAASDNEKKDSSADDSDATPDLSMWGPTVGRRRTFQKSSNGGSGAEKASGTASASDNTGKKKEGNSLLDTFQIGGALDFLPKPAAVAAAAAKASGAPQQVKPRKRDTLMEALMGALDDDNDAVGDTEEIVFLDDDSGNQAASNTASPTIAVLPPPSDSKNNKNEENETTSEASKEGASGDAKATQEGTSNDEDEDGDIVDVDVGDDDDLDDMNDDDVSDVDDAELEDLENMLSGTAKK